MTLDPAERAAAAVTLVLRVWRTGPPQQAAFRYETTHVQTGDVAYFRNLERATEHLRCLIGRVRARPTDAPPPIPFPVHEKEDQDQS